MLSTQSSVTPAIYNRRYYFPISSNVPTLTIEAKGGISSCGVFPPASSRFPKRLIPLFPTGELVLKSVVGRNCLICCLNCSSGSKNTLTSHEIVNLPFEWYWERLKFGFWSLAEVSSWKVAEQWLVTRRRQYQQSQLARRANADSHHQRFDLPFLVALPWRCLTLAIPEPTLHESYFRAQQAKYPP